MSYRIGADIGGTFTDLVMTDGDGFHVAKVLTTPGEPERAVLDGVDVLLQAGAVKPQDVELVVHGTTLFTNALIERKGSRTALVTTRGFRDAVEIAREHRFDMYDLWMERPDPIAPRHLRLEVAERILADGTVLEPLDEASVEALVPLLQAEGVEAVAVCLLHSYRHAAHERRVGEILAAKLPGVAISLSCDVNPEIREYDRASTTLCNVYVKGIAERYLGRLEEKLHDKGLPGALYVMQSQGGACDIETAPALPIHLEDHQSFTEAAGMDPGFGAILDRDTENLILQQEGLEASAKPGLTLGNYQEIRVRNFERAIEKYTGIVER